MKRNIVITTSWDDGDKEDFYLLELLQKYNLKGTFYLPVSRKGKKISLDLTKEISKSSEVGAHTFSHQDLTKLTYKKAEKEIEKGKEFLENATGKEVKVFAYPFGKTNSEIKNIARRNFLYSRGVGLFNTLPNDLLNSATTAHAYQHKLPVYFLEAIKSLQFKYLFRTSFNWDKISLRALQDVLENGGVWHLWGHSWEIKEKMGWKKFESFLQEVSKQTSKVPKITNSQIPQVLEDWKTQVYEKENPKAFDLNKNDLKIFQEIQWQTLEKFKKEKTSSVLDIGSGTGRFSTFTEGSYLGIEKAENFLVYSKENYGKKKARRFEKPKKTVGKFDLILLIGSLEDKINPKESLSSLVNNLSSNGKIIFTVLNKRNLFNYLNNFFSSNSKTYPRAFFEKKEILSVCKKSFGKNFNIESTDYWVIPPTRKLTPGLNWPLLNKVYEFGLNLLETLNRKLKLNLGSDLVVVLTRKKQV